MRQQIEHLSLCFRTAFVLLLTALVLLAAPASADMKCDLELNTHWSARLARALGSPWTDFKFRRASRARMKEIAGAIAGSDLSVETATVSELVASGIPLDEVTLHALAIPEAAHQNYNSVTGEFDYKTDRPYNLRVENGDSPLRQLRMNVSWRGGSSRVQSRNLEIIQELMETETELKVDVVGTSVA